jgi:hypothetical protein
LLELALRRKALPKSQFVRLVQRRQLLVLLEKLYRQSLHLLQTQA